MAVVTVGGTSPGTLYVHVDHLGSVDVLTNESGTPVEKRSYDPFGQRRNPAWGGPVQASFPNLTTVGFTGQEADNELGLVNMKGRMYDPKVGRFLTTDPVVSDPLSSQHWNPYSYVGNNPLNFVDPTGFEGEDKQPRPDPDEFAKDPEVQRILAEGCHHGDECAGFVKTGEGPRRGSLADPAAGWVPKPVSDVDVSQAMAALGARLAPNDVSTNGSGSGDWSQHPFVQLFGGFGAGVALGVVPFAGLGRTTGGEDGRLGAREPGGPAGARRRADRRRDDRGVRRGDGRGSRRLRDEDGHRGRHRGADDGDLGGDRGRRDRQRRGGDPGVARPLGRGSGGIRANAAKGAAWEQQVVDTKEKTDANVVQQLTVKTNSGVRTRVDIASRDASGSPKLTEAKSSATAPLTRNQRAAFPEIARSGGTVVGQGKPGFPGGTQIPPTTVDIVRP